MPGKNNRICFIRVLGSLSKLADRENRKIEGLVSSSSTLIAMSI
jgi:hypothetical protein